MNKTGVQILSSLLSLIAAAMTSNATVIYTAMTPAGGWTVPSLNGEVGTQVNAAGTDRYVTSLDIEIYSQNGIFPAGTPGFADFRAQLYANNGFLGQPGSLLWQSAVVHVNYPGGLSLLTFDVPDVLVPDAFTWTLQYSNTSPVPPALPGAAAPTVGSNGASWGRGSGVNPPWVSLPGSGPFMAEIEAVPEPASGALLLAGSLALWLSQKWKNR